jgi:hypothetical protein
MMVVEVESGPDYFRPSAPRALFNTHIATDPTFARQYDVTPDGQRFLLNQPLSAEDTETPITLIMSWPRLLERK